MSTSLGAMTLLQTVTPVEPLLQKLVHRLYCPPLLSFFANFILYGESVMVSIQYRFQNTNYHHVHEGLGVLPVPWSKRWSWSLHLFLGHPMFLCPFGLYCSTCFGIQFVSILCACCSHFYWYCLISFTIFCAPVFSPTTLFVFFI
jgi:hypothetical protein